MKIKFVPVFVPAIKTEEKLCSRVFFFRTQTTNNHRTGLSDISFSGPFNRETNYIKTSNRFLDSRDFFGKFLVLVEFWASKASEQGYISLFIFSLSIV